MNSKLIISALLSLIAVQVSQIESKESDTSSTNKKIQAAAVSDHTAKASNTTSGITVALTAMEVKKNAAGNNELVWTIPANKKSESFLVQRSEDGKTFRTIGRRSPKENTVSYSFEDAGYNKDAYYRIVEVDLEGKVSYSQAVKKQE